MSTAAVLPSSNGREARRVKSEWTTLTNLRSFHYVTTGPADAPALLFLHGYADSWRSGELLMPHLDQHFRIFALDQRGHGESDRNFERYAIDDFAADAADFIHHEIGRPVILVGHSLGSLVAQRVAAEYRDLVTRLVLIGSTDTLSGNPAATELRHALEELGDSIPRQFVEEFQAGTVAKPLPPDQFEIFVGESLRLRPAVWRRTADGMIEDAKISASRIGIPTLILWGERDSIFDAAAQQRLNALLKNSELIAYPDIGHAPNWEIPERVARDIIAFAKV